MKKLFFLILYLLITVKVYSQFEQKVSLNFSIGGFKTVGKTLGKLDLNQNQDPAQMPNYRTGINCGAELQFNLNRHFSILVDASIMSSGSWYYKTGDYNYLHYIIIDTLSGQTLAEGENKLNLFNFSIGLVPKFYFFAVKKWNPYVFAGINLNITSAKYTDNSYAAGKRLNLIAPGDTPYDPYLEKNTGLGFLSGLGLECSPTEKFSFFLESGYNLILLNDNNFKSPYLVENLNAIIFRTGIRFSFLKSKNL